MHALNLIKPYITCNNLSLSYLDLPVSYRVIGGASRKTNITFNYGKLIIMTTFKVKEHHGLYPAYMFLSLVTFVHGGGLTIEDIHIHVMTGDDTIVLCIYVMCS